MILYMLACDDGHRFESWFPSSTAFDDQRDAQLVACPTCGSQHVSKAIMAPAVFGARQPELATEDASPAPCPSVPAADTKGAQVRALMKAFREKILAEADDVGSRFPEEARRMHEGEIPERRILGQATAREALELIEDGIGVMPLPALPEELN